MLPQILGQIIGRTIAQQSGWNAGLHQAGAAAGIRATMRSDRAHVARQLALATTEVTARRLLAATWNTRYRQFAAALARPATDDNARMARMVTHAQLAVFDDPVFDDLPLWAAGLRCDDRAAMPARWIGAADALVSAVEALIRRGAEVKLDDDAQLAEVRRGGVIVARLGAIDPAPPGLPPLVMPATPKPWAWGLTWAVGFVGVMLGFVLLAQQRFGLGVAVMTAPLTAVVIGRRLLARRPHRPWRTASIAASTAAAPYRDRAEAATTLAIERAIACAQTAELASARTAATLTIGDDAVRLAVPPDGPLRLPLAVRFRDRAVLMRFAASLTTATGPLTVDLGDAQLELDDAAGFERWQARDAAERAAIASLAADLDRGYRLAIARL